MNPQSRQNQLAPWRAARGLVAAGLMLALSAAPAGWAGDTPATASAGAGDVQFTVTEAPTAQQMITVPVNQGVLVDFNKAASRCGASSRISWFRWTAGTKRSTPRRP